MCVQGSCSVCSGYAVLFGAFASCPKHAGTGAVLMGVVACFGGSVVAFNPMDPMDG